MIQIMFFVFIYSCLWTALVCLPAEGLLESTKNEHATESKLLIPSAHYFLATISIFFFVTLAIGIMYLWHPAYRPGLAVSLTALLFTAYTDLRNHVIFDLPNRSGIIITILSSLSGALPTNALQSIIGAITAFFFLYAVEYSWQKIKKTTGLGSGDKEVLALIGALTGLSGWWYALGFGAFFGVCYALIMRITNHKTIIAIPFVPFLTLGTLVVLAGQALFLI